MFGIAGNVEERVTVSGFICRDTKLLAAGGTGLLGRALLGLALTLPGGVRRRRLEELPDSWPSPPAAFGSRPQPFVVGGQGLDPLRQLHHEFDRLGV